MGNCNSTVCEYSDLSVEADPDVAGIGVRLSFMIRSSVYFRFRNKHTDEDI